MARRKPRTIKKKPLQPCVTLEQIYAYDPAKPETATPSPLLNALLSAMFELCPLSAAALGRYLGFEARKITGAIEMITGMQFGEFREKWGRHLVKRLRREHPDWTLDRCVRAAGYADPSALWNADHRARRKAQYRELLAYMALPAEEKERRYQAFLSRHGISPDSQE